ncbi:hypothetical protein PR048_002251 [Dryococelus australis]|uniref:Uncharacterized protein n=1 Tax=Dryococelus australis TaxID=614101 RepID=A0ABQ9IL82_9NEOP|nr:hypothetical protein PR048_002251 [Dryococelus australis]
MLVSVNVRGDGRVFLRARTGRPLVNPPSVLHKALKTSVLEHTTSGKVDCNSHPMKFSFARRGRSAAEQGKLIPLTSQRMLASHRHPTCQTVWPPGTGMTEHEELRVPIQDPDMSDFLLSFYSLLRTWLMAQLQCFRVGSGCCAGLAAGWQQAAGTRTILERDIAPGTEDGADLYAVYPVSGPPLPIVLLPRTSHDCVKPASALQSPFQEPNGNIYHQAALSSVCDKLALEADFVEKLILISNIQEQLSTSQASFKLLESSAHANRGFNLIQSNSFSSGEKKAKLLRLKIIFGKLQASLMRDCFAATTYKKQLACPESLFRVLTPLLALGLWLGAKFLVTLEHEPPSCFDTCRHSGIQGVKSAWVKFAYYSALLRKLKPTFLSKRRGLLPESFILLHDNVVPSVCPYEAIDSPMINKLGYTACCMSAIYAVGAPCACRTVIRFTLCVIRGGLPDTEIMYTFFPLSTGANSINIHTTCMANDTVKLPSSFPQLYDTTPSERVQMFEVPMNSDLGILHFERLPASPRVAHTPETLAEELRKEIQLIGQRRLYLTTEHRNEAGRASKNAGMLWHKLFKMLA